MRSDVSWGESKSGRAHSLALCPENRNDVRGADRAETLRGRVVTGWCGRVASVFLQVEEDIKSRSNWAGCWGLRSEVRDGLTLDGILLVVQGEGDLGGMLKLLVWGVWGGGGCCR